MKGFLRRRRGIIGTGLAWAVGGIAAFSGLLALRGAPWEIILTSIPTGAWMGFVCGSAFAGILIVTERRRKLEDLSLRRVALWGAIGGFLVTGAVNLLFAGALFWPAIVTVSLLSSGLASGTVAVAKKGSEPKLIEWKDEDLPALEGE
jgi:hypothetical protein